jgi:uncharacterized oxidoreductase
MNLSGNTVLVTGGSSGIGLAMAEAFAAAGSAVIVCGRDVNRLAGVVEKHPYIQVRQCDVANAADRERLASWLAQSFPSLNVLVNNAGIQRDLDLTHGADELQTGESEIAVNLEAPIVLSAMLTPRLADKPNATIINVTSGLGFVPIAGMPVYCATKAGMHAFTMALRKQLEPMRVRVFEVVPPAVDTGLNAEGRSRRGGYRPDLSPARFVSAVMKGLAHDVPEIGFGPTCEWIRASRAELDRAFEAMNARRRGDDRTSVGRS